MKEFSLSVIIVVHGKREKMDQENILLVVYIIIACMILSH